MMMINKISKKLIKPHTPTPQNLKNYHISFLDQSMEPVINFSIVLFYESKPEKKSQLEESLAKILVQFYPLAGRYIKNDLYIDCSDDGVEFIEAEATNDVVLTDFVTKSTESEQLKDLFPDHYFRVDEAPHDPLLSIQATYFPCGGLSIAISVSHRVIDASSLGTFIAAWSNASNPEGNKIVTPSFDLPSLLPKKVVDRSKQQLIIDDRHDHDHDEDAVVGKRFSFNKEALTKLRSKLRQDLNGKTIPAVRVVSAVIAKALIGVDRVKHGRSRDFVLTQAINMRERTSPVSLPKHACGNFALAFLARCVPADEVEAGIGIQQLVDDISDAVRKSIGDYSEMLPPNEGDGRDVIKNSFDNLTKQLSNPDLNAICITDWSKFGFYDADFGWGNPVWTGLGPQNRMFSTATTALMSDKAGDGIEAWLYWNRNDLRCFEQDADIILYTT